MQMLLASWLTMWKMAVKLILSALISTFERQAYRTSSKIEQYSIKIHIKRSLESSVSDFKPDYHLWDNQLRQNKIWPVSSTRQTSTILVRVAITYTDLASMVTTLQIWAWTIWQLSNPIGIGNTQRILRISLDAPKKQHERKTFPKVLAFLKMMQVFLHSNCSTIWNWKQRSSISVVIYSIMIWNKECSGPIMLKLYIYAKSIRGLGIKSCVWQIRGGCHSIYAMKDQPATRQ